MESFKKFMAGDSSAHDGPYIETLLAIRNNPACTQEGARNQVLLAIDSIANRARQEDELDRQHNGGFSSIRACDPDKPDCSETDVVLPGRVVATMLDDITSLPSERFANVESEKDLPEEDLVSMSYTLSSEGINNFDTSLLETDSANSTVARFHDAIKNGYFDLQGGTTDWALGAMLQIYDRGFTLKKLITPTNEGGGDDSTGEDVGI
jgi:hypothetical protein